MYVKWAGVDEDGDPFDPEWRDVMDLNLVARREARELDATLHPVQNKPKMPKLQETERVVGVRRSVRLQGREGREEMHVESSSDVSGSEWEGSEE